MATSLIDKIYNAGRNWAAQTNSRGAAQAIASVIGLDATQLANVLESLKQPSLCFVPIQSESISMRRAVDIGTTMLISQTDQKKDYVTDNAAPKPRVWSGTGYIKSIAPLVENGMLIKPTLMVQQAILEAAADSRQTVKFKTDMGEVVDVLIQDLQISASPRTSGAKAISYVVQEVKVLENAVLSGIIDVALDKVGMASIPRTAIVNLGKNLMLGSGITNVATGLLGIRW